MKTSEIKFSVQLDGENVPEKIYWEASDNPNEGLEETRAIAVAVWDHFHRATMKIDLWAKDMEVGDMKRFGIEAIGGLADSLLRATGDQPMYDAIDTLCRELSKKLDEEMRQQAKP